MPSRIRVTVKGLTKFKKETKKVKKTMSRFVVTLKALARKVRGG